MKVIKNLIPLDRKQVVIRTNLYELESNKKKIPLILTTELSQLSISWWKNGSSWATETIVKHNTMNFNRGSMRQAQLQNWSAFDSLILADNNLFAVFKRTLNDSNNNPALFLQEMLWDPINEDISIVGIPIPIPIDQKGYNEAGISLWATFDGPSQKIRILAQLIRLEVTRISIDPRDIELPFPDVRWFEVKKKKKKDKIKKEKKEKKKKDKDFRKKIFEEIFQGEFGIRKSDREELLVELPLSYSTNISELVLLTISIGNDYSDHQNWDFKVLDEGGYHLDALKRDTKIIMVHRKEPYSIVTPLPHSTSSGDAFDVGIISDVSEYNPLSLLEYDLTNDHITSQDDNLPGGDNPIIQTTHPMQISIERIDSGPATIIPAYTSTGMGGGFNVSAFARPLPSRIQVFILQESPLGWSVFDLIRYVTGSFPRLLGYTDIRSHWRNEIIDNSKLGISSMVSMNPIALLRRHTIENIPQNQGKPGEVFEFMYHHIGLGALVITQILIGSPSQNLGDAVVDLNHQQITEPPMLNDEIPTHAMAQNGQFRPFNFNMEQYRADNTIGGSLSWFSRLEPLYYYSYTDMGDGGSRVIYDSGQEIPDDYFPQSKSFQVESLAPPPLGDDEQWVEIETTGWIDVALPLYDVRQPLLDSRGIWVTSDQNLGGSTPFGLSVAVDTLIFFADLDPRTSVTLKENSFNQALIEIASLLGIELDPWNELWAPIQNLREATEEDGATIYNIDLSVGKYDIQYKYTEEEERLPSEVVINPHRIRAQCKFREGAGQGYVDYKIPVAIESTDIDLGSGWHYFNFDAFQLEIELSTSYTPGILSSETRTSDPFESYNEFNPPVEIATEDENQAMTTLSMKPVKDFDINITKNNVDLSVTKVFVLYEFLVVLAAFSLFFLVDKIVALDILAESGNIIIVVIAVILLSILIYKEAPKLVAKEIEKKLAEHINSLETKIQFTESGFLQYAGEGLAEALAIKIMEGAHPPIPVNDNGVLGRNRFHLNRWQMIVVTQNILKAKIRV